MQKKVFPLSFMTTTTTTSLTFVFLITIYSFLPHSKGVKGDQNTGPSFNGPIANVTVPVGRDATLRCTVDNLSIYKVAWLKVDTQTILTIHVHVITKNNRIGVTHSEQKTWFLHIRNVKETDRGWYMCQINTDPMKSQIGFLDVVVPPDILDYPTSADITVREGSNASFTCTAKGSPEPSITWRREDGEPISLGYGNEVLKIEGNEFGMVKVNRLQMGPYLCIASNGIPPTVSKRIMLDVHFPPMISIPNQLIGTYFGHDVSLICHSEAYPKSVNFWTGDDGITLTTGGKYEIIEENYGIYKKMMKLIIKKTTSTDIGAYRCVAKNFLGETDGNIKIYATDPPTTAQSTSTTTTTTTTTQMENVIVIEKLTPPTEPFYQSDINNSYDNSVGTEIRVISTANEVNSYKSFNIWQTLSSSTSGILNRLNLFLIFCYCLFSMLIFK